MENRCNYLSEWDEGKRYTVSGDALYCQVINVIIRKCGVEERRNLRIIICHDVETNAGCRQNLSVKIMDDDDPFILYSLLITEDDFKNLRDQQGLLVDFGQFPDQYVQLLEKCRLRADSHSTNRYLLILDEDDRVGGIFFLKIVETNNFKQLCHLSLKIVSGNDSEVKKHMAFNIKNLKELLAKTEQYRENLEMKIKDLYQKWENKCKDFEEIQQKLNEEKAEINLRCSQEITSEKEKLAEVRLEWHCKFEQERQEMEGKYQKIIKGLEEKNSHLQLLNQAAVDKEMKKDDLNREQVRHLQSLEKELAQIQREVTTLRKQNTKLDNDYHEKEKALNSFKTKLAVSEQESRDKSVLLNKQQDMIQVANEQKSHLEDILTEKESNIQRKQVSLQNLSDELVKANEIMSKLQHELTTAKSKLKLRTDIALEQEGILDNQQKELLSYKDKVSTMEEKIKSLELSENHLQEELICLQNKLEEKDKTIKNNDNVINWLNRRLTEMQSESTAIPNGGVKLGSKVSISTPQTSFNPIITSTQSYLQSKLNSTSLGVVGSQIQTMKSGLKHISEKQLGLSNPGFQGKAEEPASKQNKSESLTKIPVPMVPKTSNTEKPAKNCLSSAYFPKST